MSSVYYVHDIHIPTSIADFGVLCKLVNQTEKEYGIPKNTGECSGELSKMPMHAILGTNSD